jgi:membrane protein implicated in regulation of membrane protease activity
MGSFWDWVLIVAGALLVLVEVAFGGFAGFDLVLIGSTFIVGGAAGMALRSPAIGFVIAAVLCVIYIGAGRKLVRARMQTKAIPTNSDALIGLKGVVTQRIAPHLPGQIRVRDETWRAGLAAGIDGPLENGTEVTVTAVEGVTLQVR